MKETVHPRQSLKMSLKENGTSTAVSEDVEHCHMVVWFQMSVKMTDEEEKVEQKDRQQPDKYILFCDPTTRMHDEPHKAKGNVRISKSSALHNPFNILASGS